MLHSTWKGEIVDQVRCQPARLLRQKDQSTGWKITQALFGMPADEIDLEECRLVLEVLKERKLIGVCAGKDRDGDTTLNTAVKTGDENRLKVLLDQLPPTLLNKILETPNKQCKTPLQLAFDRRNWPVLQTILELCVKNRLCSQLTGIGENLTANTLLHQAMDKGECHFLGIYLDTTSENPDCGVPGLLVCDETGQTPWSYLMNHCNHQFLEDTLRVLNRHKVDVNELITDKNSRSTMLHLAYRKNCLSCINLLENAGAKPEKKDKRGFRADQRNHTASSRPKRRRKSKMSHCKCKQAETDHTVQPTCEQLESRIQQGSVNSTVPLAPISRPSHQEIVISTKEFRVVQRKRKHRKKDEKPLEEETPHNIVQSPSRNRYHCTYSWDHLRMFSKLEVGIESINSSGVCELNS